MAQLSRDELEQVLEHYDLGALKDVEAVEGGFVNDNAVIVTERGTYFVKRRHPALRPLQLIRFQHAVILHLLREEFPAPPLIRTQAGETFLQTAGEVYTIHGYIAGEPCDPAKPAHFRQAAETLADYHRTVQGFRFQGAPKPEWLYRPEVARLLVGRLRDSLPGGQTVQFSLTAVAVQADLLDEAISPERYRSLPSLIIHGDYYADNLRFQDDEVVALCDYDNATWQARAVELAEALIYFARADEARYTHLVYPTVLDRERMGTFLKSYHGELPLEREELEALPHLIKAVWLAVSLRRLWEREGIDVETAEATLREIRALVGWVDEHGEDLQKSFEEIRRSVG